MAHTVPTIHLNGTSPQALADEYLALVRAIRSAGDALDSATCNGRDFYPQGEEAWKNARREREEAYRKLREVREYAEAWLEKVSDHL